MDGSGANSRKKNESREEQRRRMPEFMMAVMLLIAVFLVSRQAGLMVSGQAVAVGARRPVVVLDSGHGGNDPGKIGVDGSLEKEINLQIARRLKTYLEASDVTVVMTREDDRGLYEETDSSKKMADMKNRCGKNCGGRARSGGEHSSKQLPPGVCIRWSGFLLQNIRRAPCRDSAEAL